MKSEKKFVNNDIYFIEIIQDKIIINDNYDGIIVLNNELEIIKNLYLLDDIVIDTSYAKDNEVILLADDGKVLVRINMLSCIVQKEYIEKNIFNKEYVGETK